MDQEAGEAPDEMGGAKLVERQRSQNKLPVRERIDLLLDPGTFVEFAQLADSMDPVLSAQRGYLAADGMVARKVPLAATAVWTLAILGLVLAFSIFSQH